MKQKDKDGKKLSIRELFRSENTLRVLICALGVGYVFVASNVRYAELGRQVVAGADKVDWFDGVVSAIETDADNMSLYPMPVTMS